MVRVLLMVMAGVLACSPAPSRQPPSDPVGDYLARTLPDGFGGTVLAGRGGDITYCEGVGLADRDSGTAATCDTVYDVMSITKQFTAAAVLKLETMGKLRVSDPIGTHLGPVPADKRGITLHHLLTHTSGLVEGLGDDYDAISREDMLAGALASRLVSTPGEEFHYSNVGYSVLAAVVEKASGVGYEQFLSQRLFLPAGMRDTGYVIPRWSPDQVAVEYDETGTSQGRPYDHPWAADGPHWNLRGNGGMLSTARDMFRWHRALTDATVLSSSARQKLFTPQVRMPGMDVWYAYGWAILDTAHGEVAWHNGGNDWSLANYARELPDGAMTYWVSNQAYAEDWNLEDVELELTKEILERA
ncbi:serine hydrolase domain-containing protein [Actinophytocola algeriensis]|uniref:CubicO group peptidase (Beta-lactamase class C family) n=1 Tax=Actinophytocola algeriensis TaxID=1768010 RepID=A0A7W7QGW7_9PSEU|nr:serine hydrolase domain-containing protein [Actinophytocola algeriensis]MBB4912851.1 CubicO group peptidase (beta-lactamase class C family) [Actinophytocola algeriensis]MBE1474115.1 CubicO group peptidase (beta-lactamase class C family) [Actinophytocola algeriensis]